MRLPAVDGIDRVVLAPDDEARHAHAPQIVPGNAAAPADEQMPERIRGSAHAKLAFPELEPRVRRLRRVRRERSLHDASDEPVGARDDPEDRRVVRIQEQVREPAAAAADGQRVAVQQHDPGNCARPSQRGRDRHRRAERMADEHGPADAELRVERAHELDPVRERERPAPLRIAERRQVEREHTVRARRAASRRPARPTTARRSRREARSACRWCPSADRRSTSRRRRRTGRRTATPQKPLVRPSPCCTRTTRSWPA